eukprot:EC722866.1.p1 GENE.EC722866.1~~EC722866.1.p1  ORF type:complete len:153 (+),score=18.11 EC722866.1:33-461(+)
MTEAAAGAAPVSSLRSHNFHDANFPTDAEGRVYHVGVKKGEVANRILSVGSEARAAVIASFLDSPEKTFVKRSSRGFVTYTGTRNGVPVSIIVTGMGVSMIDFVWLRMVGRWIWSLGYCSLRYMRYSGPHGACRRHCCSLCR